MFFFIDESWQTIAGTKIGTLGCVAIPAAEYNRFCRVVYKIKQEELGAQELQEKELKGTVNFCKAAFRAAVLQGESSSLVAINRVLHALHESDASLLSVSTVAPIELSIRDNEKSLLTDPYVDLVQRMYALMKTNRDKRGLLFFDQMGHREDQRAACAVQNFFVRTTFSYSLSKLFVQVPHFTHSSVSPGLQVADLIAYLCAHTVDDFKVRPELQPWWQDFAALSYNATVRGQEISSVAPYIGAHGGEAGSSSAERFDLAEDPQAATGIAQNISVTGEP